MVDDADAIANSVRKVLATFLTGTGKKPLTKTGTGKKIANFFAWKTNAEGEYGNLFIIQTYLDEFIYEYHPHEKPNDKMYLWKQYRVLINNMRNEVFKQIGKKLTKEVQLVRMIFSIAHEKLLQHKPDLIYQGEAFEPFIDDVSFSYVIDTSYRSGKSIINIDDILIKKPFSLNDKTENGKENIWDKTIKEHEEKWQALIQSKTSAAPTLAAPTAAAAPTTVAAPTTAAAPTGDAVVGAANAALDYYKTLNPKYIEKEINVDIQTLIQKLTTTSNNTIAHMVKVFGNNP